MANQQINPNIALLRRNVSLFLGSKARLKIPLLQALSRLTKKGISAVLFGGTLRDLMIRGPYAEPRDIDIVADTSLDNLTDLFSDLLIRKTRFGGLHLNAKGWMIDVWPLSATWAFRELRFGAGDFEALTKTTFLNVEAVNIELGRLARSRRVHTYGFFEAVTNRTLDINLEENPFPQLATIRTLITASALNYGMSRRLATYVAHHLKQTPLEEFLEIQKGHYGWVRCDISGMRKWSNLIKNQIGTQTIVRALTVEPEQLTLWRDKNHTTETIHTSIAGPAHPL